MDISRNVELGVVVGALGVAHLLAVDPHVGTAIDTVEVEEHAVAGPVGGQREVAAQGADRVVEVALHRDVGRIVLEGIIDIDIPRIAVALHLNA